MPVFAKNAVFLNIICYNELEFVFCRKDGKEDEKT